MAKPIKRYTAWIEIQATKTERAGAWTIGGTIVGRTTAEAKANAIAEVAESAKEAGVGRRRLRAHVTEVKS